MVRKNLPVLSTFLRFDRECSELGPPLITKAGSASGDITEFSVTTHTGFDMTKVTIKSIN